MADGQLKFQHKEKRWMLKQCSKYQSNLNDESVGKIPKQQNKQKNTTTHPIFGSPSKKTKTTQHNTSPARRISRYLLLYGENRQTKHDIEQMHRECCIYSECKFFYLQHFLYYCLREETYSRYTTELLSRSFLLYKCQKKPNHNIQTSEAPLYPTMEQFLSLRKRLAACFHARHSPNTLFLQFFSIRLSPAGQTKKGCCGDVTDI